MAPLQNDAAWHSAKMWIYRSILGTNTQTHSKNVCTQIPFTFHIEILFRAIFECVTHTNHSVYAEWPYQKMASCRWCGNMNYEKHNTNILITIIIHIGSLCYPLCGILWTKARKKNSLRCPINVNWFNVAKIKWYKS